MDFKPRYGHGKPAHSELFNIIDAYRDDYKDLIKKILSLKEIFWTIRDSKVETDPTKVAYKAKTEQNLITEIVSIDPKPVAEIDDLANHVIRIPFENIDLDSLYELDENDILFIDNSHRILPNSDSTVFYLEILPRLKKGVVVHIHDIYI